MHKGIKVYAHLLGAYLEFVGDDGEDAGVLGVHPDARGCSVPSPAANFFIRVLGPLLPRLHEASTDVRAAKWVCYCIGVRTACCFINN